MPDQPADPLHYDMKIPPENKENKPDQPQHQHISVEPTPESSTVSQPLGEREKPASETPSK